ncbi:hypothetical protein BEN49_22370 [Hymenobacter coccineus]|uniref:Uncharacterized protein n=1 Tax=Hymenobacter coccineus TaxID=1908235 RepID=A0A1G1TIA7_9BACT|nr:hypothetical protein BEN49_22370 [Hymenobacter coccineus]
MPPAPWQADQSAGQKTGGKPGGNRCFRVVIVVPGTMAQRGTARWPAFFLAYVLFLRKTL